MTRKCPRTHQSLFSFQLSAKQLSESLEQTDSKRAFRRKSNTCRHLKQAKRNIGD